MLSIIETKKKFLDFLYARGVYIRAVDEREYQTRCPYCGDSTKNYNTGHFYVHVDTDNNFNMPFFCFKCQAYGVITPDTLELMANEDNELAAGIHNLNKKGRHQKGYESNDKYLYFDWKLPKEHRYPKKLQYIKDRMGIDFTSGDFESMKVVTSLYDFLLENEIKQSPFTKQQRIILEKDYVGFISSGNSHILFRDTTGTHKDAWVKYPISDESKKNRVYYGMSTEIDILTKDKIVINLSEGVFDAIGVTYHLGYNASNIFNIAVCGSFFNIIIKRMISMGVFGSNVTLNIFSDNDRNYNDRPVKGSEEWFHMRYLEKYKPLFGEINLFYNLKAKDYGVKKENIIIKKIKV